MLERLDDAPWAEIEHAYGTAEDVPDLLRALLDPDEEVREEALEELYGNVFHQGTRFPAAAYVVPFLIEMCASPDVPDRGALLRYWGSLITGFFSVRERPTWGDGEQAYLDGGPVEADDDGCAEVLHRVYRESLKGRGLLPDLLIDADPAVRAGAAWVVACLPTVAGESVPALTARLNVEPSEWVRAAIAFALGELGAAGPLRRALAEEQSAAVRCMAACELARIEPSDDLIEPLLRFVAEPIEGYANVPGAGGESAGDAAFAISLLSPDARRAAIPALFDRLGRTRSFDTMPLVESILSAAFPPRPDRVETLTDLQRDVLARLVDVEEHWSIGNLHWVFESRGLPSNRKACARLVGVKVARDEALDDLRFALAHAEMGTGFFGKAREGILKALEADPAVFERAPASAESWLLCARAFAETEPDRALDAFRRAVAIDPAVANRIERTGPLMDLLKKEGDDLPPS